MGLTILLGAQWGDEGKGRVTDLLSEGADVTARFSGGDNAGHTVTVGQGAEAQTFKLHLLPSGVIQPRTVNVLGNGMVINPARLRGELATLAQAGITLSPERLKISHAAHLITPAHVALDKAEEDARGVDKIGTTGRGIGPAYTAKIGRGGLRAELFKDPEALADRIETHVARVNRTLTGLYGAAELDAATIAAEYADHAQALAPYITETSLFLDRRLRVGGLGCGTGTFSALIAPYVARVVAVDASAEMLAAARARLAAFPTVDVRRGTLEALPVDDQQLDIAVLALVLHHVPDPGRAIAEAARVVAPGGRVLIVDMLPHDRSDYQQQMGHVWLGFSEPQIRRWFDSAGFSDARIEALTPEATAKGPALFRAVATK